MGMWIKQVLENEWWAKDKIEMQSHFSIYTNRLKYKENKYVKDIIAHSIFIKLWKMRIAETNIFYKGNEQKYMTGEE